VSQTPQTCPLASFRAFASGEREHYSSTDGQRVVTALRQVERYLQFLQIIKTRHEAASKSVLGSFERLVAEAQAGHNETRALTQEELAELERDAQRHTVLHLEIESFFLFAKIVLDKTAQYLEDYFGRVRGASMQSHDKWCKALDTFEREKGIHVPEHMRALMISLRASVADYRDKRIAHFKNSRAIFPTFIAGGGQTQIGALYTPPKDSDDHVRSARVDGVYHDLDQYVACVIELIRSNRAKTRYALAGQVADRLTYEGLDCAVTQASGREGREMAQEERGCGPRDQPQSNLWFK
jgi:hypothetical protein